jgi:copper chaperone CopZ
MSGIRAGCGLVKAALLWPQAAEGSAILNMMPAPTVCAAAILSMVMFGAGCSRPAHESRIKSIEARIDGLTCPTCVPPLTASLKQQYGKSAIEVDDDKDTATIHFAENDNFSAADFRAAVARVRMRVVTLRVQACGTVETTGGDKWLTAGGTRFLVQSDRELPVNEPICVDGTLDSHNTPAIFQVSAFSTQSASGS